jgi:outer membrane protein assembly factor BamB
VLKWRNDAVRGESVPVVDGTAIYNLEQETHVLSAVRKTDGVLIWRKTLPVTNPAFDGYGLGISGGILVVGDLDLFGVDPATGSILWKYAQSTGRNPGFGRFAIQDGVVYCGSTSGHVFAVEAATGIEKWVTQAAPDTSSIYDPIVFNGVIYAGLTAFGHPNRPGAIAVRASDGTALWTTLGPTLDGGYSNENTAGVVAFGDTVFFGSGLGIHVVRRSSGELLSTIPGSSIGSSGLTEHRPFRLGSTLLVAAGNATVTALDPATLAQKWKQSTAGSLVSITGDSTVAYFPQQDALVAVLLQTGAIKWSFKSSSVGHSFEFFISGPAFDGDAVYAAGSKGVYALGRG